jgi:hypothetical protein
MKLKLGSILVVLLCLATALSFQNCSKVAFKESFAETPVVVDTTGGSDGIVPGTDVPTTLNFKADDSGYVCSPFGGGPITATSGLKAELRYINPAAAISVSEKNSLLSVNYFNDANPNIIKSAQSVYLPDVNVPSRVFSQGFTSSDGKTLKDNAGQVLIEYFALKMESILKLSATDLEGYYELATLSDDGTVLEAQINGVWTRLINNDGPKPTTMGCMNNKIFFDRNTKLPIRLYYNQGPRTEIANVLVWNYRGTNSAANSSPISDSVIRTHCGRSNSTEFWNPANSAVGPWFGDMTSNQGWKIIKSNNFFLPDNEVNPCAFNAYDLNPQLTATLLSGTNQKIRFQSTDSTVFRATLYRVDGANKVLVKNIPEQAEDFVHEFETGSLDTKLQYRLEIEVSLPAKNLKVLRVYLLSFVQ